MLHLCNKLFPILVSILFYLHDQKDTVASVIFAILPNSAWHSYRSCNATQYMTNLKETQTLPQLYLHCHPNQLGIHMDPSIGPHTVYNSLAVLPTIRIYPDLSGNSWENPESGNQLKKSRNHHEKSERVRIVKNNTNTVKETTWSATSRRIVYSRSRIKVIFYT